MPELGTLHQWEGGRRTALSYRCRKQGASLLQSFKAKRRQEEDSRGEKRNSCPVVAARPHHFAFFERILFFTHEYGIRRFYNREKKRATRRRTRTTDDRPPFTSAIMMSMNSKQPFSMHPILHEPKYNPLHSSSEAIRRACLPTPSVRGRFILRVNVGPETGGLGSSACFSLTLRYD